jgi:hypothetical protein
MRSLFTVTAPNNRVFAYRYTRLEGYNSTDNVLPAGRIVKLNPLHKGGDLQSWAHQPIKSFHAKDKYLLRTTADAKAVVASPGLWWQHFKDPIELMQVFDALPSGPLKTGIKPFTKQQVIDNLTKVFSTYKAYAAEREVILSIGTLKKPLCEVVEPPFGGAGQERFKIKQYKSKKWPAHV